MERFKNQCLWLNSLSHNSFSSDSNKRREYTLYYPALDLDLREGKAGIADSATEHCWKIRLRRQKNERLTAKATTDHRSPITVHWKLLGNLKQSV
jgi:hypothetical protein